MWANPFYFPVILIYFSSLLKKSNFVYLNLQLFLEPTSTEQKQVNGCWQSHTAKSSFLILKMNGLWVIKMLWRNVRSKGQVSHAHLELSHCCVYGAHRQHEEYPPFSLSGLLALIWSFCAWIAWRQDVLAFYLSTTELLLTAVSQVYGESRETSALGEWVLFLLLSKSSVGLSPEEK